MTPRDHSPSPYPAYWEQVADLRVFHTTLPEWEKLIGWRADMRRKGWRLLRVTSSSSEIVAIFGRTKAELLDRKAD